MITSPLRARWRQQLQSRLPHTLRAVALTSLLLVSLLAVSLLASLLAFVALYRYSGYIPTVGWSSGELELKYGYGRAPFASVAGLGKAGIATGQVYDVWLSLELPDSETNLEVGNFMVDLDLQTPLGVSAVKASKSVSRTPLRVSMPVREAGEGVSPIPNHVGAAAANPADRHLVISAVF